MFRYIFSTTINWLGSDSQFGSYYKGTLKENCTGPNIDEARRDFQAILARIGAFV